jgi:hypothetical protein
MKPLRIFNPVTKTILLALMLSITSLLVAQNVTSAAISERLKVVKSHAALAEDDAATLKSYAFSRLSWESHSARVSLMKEHINALIKDYNDLAEMRPDAVPWQQEAIDRIEPLVRETADQLTALIEHMNQNQSRLHMKPYRDYVNAHYKVVSNLHKVIADFVDYGEAKEQKEAMERELALPTTASAEK